MLHTAAAVLLVLAPRRMLLQRRPHAAQLGRRVQPLPLQVGDVMAMAQPWTFTNLGLHEGVLKLRHDDDDDSA